MPLHFPRNAAQARAQIQARWEALRAAWPTGTWERRPLPAGGEGTLEWLAAPATETPQQAVVLTAGLHGAEGPVGAAMLDLFLQAFAPRLDPRTTGLFLVPVINAWGMDHFRRVNAANVDLNRNFMPPTDAGGFPRVENPAYAALHDFLNPQRPVRPGDRWRFWWRGLAALRRAGGVAALRAASLQGQSAYPRGVFFTGQAWQPETRAMQAFWDALLAQYPRVVHVDMHTGYGPAGVLSLILPADEPESEAAWEQRLHYRPVVRVAGAEVYPVQGSMADDLMRRGRAQGRQVVSLAFEFGTLGHSTRAQLRSLRAVVLENQLHHHGASHPSMARWVRQEFQALFWPQEEAWQRRAEAQARQAFEGLLQGVLASR